MSPEKAERLRIYLAKHIFTPVAGLSFGDWARLLGRERLRVSPRYLPRALFLTLNSIPNALLRRKEMREFGPRIEQTEIRAPIFIIGHWRSGTTHLHNLMALDRRFAYPNFIQASQPHSFLSNEEKLKNSKLLKRLSPKTRMIDNMSASADAPMEDEVALCILTGLSPLLGSMFPRHRDYYQRYLTLQDLSPDELRRWQQGLLLFLRKLTLKHQRPLVLKSPPHTCRIEAILEVFPDARFVHIHRDPYRVFLSYVRSVKILDQLLQLQTADYRNLERFTIDQYREMYELFFTQREGIPPGQYCEISYEKLVADPLGEMRSVYTQLSLGGFEQVRPEIERYLNGIADYKLSKLPELAPELRARIASSWGRCFEEWGYST